MNANVKPLTHWAIYKQYKLRITSRSPATVQGIFTTSEGVLPFCYDATSMTITLPDQQVHINQYGWEERQGTP